MARTESLMVELGTVAPAFTLRNVMDGMQVSRDDLLVTGTKIGRGGLGRRDGLLIMFVCVHCPYVKHIEEELGRLGRDYFGADGRGPIGIAAIQPNDVTQSPEDGPEGMRDQAHRHSWPFPYLLDETQSVARSYGAACTPDFFLFDRELRLVYRGQLDASRPRRGDFGNDDPVTGADLRSALDALIQGELPAPLQRGSIGCNVKWRTVPA